MKCKNTLFKKQIFKKKIKLYKKNFNHTQYINILGAKYVIK